MTLIDPSFKKPNTALVMMPKVGKLTANSRKLLNSMFSVAQKHLLGLPEAGRDFNAMDFFEADLVDVIRPIGNPKSNSLEMMKGHIREMQQTLVDWTAPDQTQGIVWDSMVLVSQAKLRIENGRVRMLWSFPPDIVRSLAIPEFFTVIRLQDLAELKSYTAVALYEIIARYRTSPTNLTSRKPKEWWVAALTSDSHRTHLKDKSEHVLREWRMFKHEKVLPALEEINTKTKYRVELIEFRNGTGRQVTDIQFRVLQVKSDEAEKPLRNGPCYIAAAKLGIMLKDVAVFLERPFEPYTEDQVLLALAKIEGQSKKSGVVPIKNISAYFKKVMLQTVAPALFPELGNKPAVPETVKPVSILGGGPDSSANADDTKAVPDSPRAQLTRAFLALPIEEQRAFALMAREKLKLRGLLSPVINRKVETGYWSTGVVLDEILKVFSLTSSPP